jgi:hypothetical protein
MLPSTCRRGMPEGRDRIRRWFVAPSGCLSTKTPSGALPCALSARIPQASDAHVPRKGLGFRSYRPMGKNPVFPLVSQKPRRRRRGFCLFRVAVPGRAAALPPSLPPLDTGVVPPVGRCARRVKLARQKGEAGLLRKRPRQPAGAPGPTRRRTLHKGVFRVLRMPDACATRLTPTSHDSTWMVGVCRILRLSG